MESLYLLIPLSVVLVFGILLVFAWSLGNGQFDDLEAQGRRVVDDDDSPQSEAATSTSKDATSISETAKSTPDSGHHAKSSKP
jgi:cbb3-type cytochrome oxidase maturation protein